MEISIDKISKTPVYKQISEQICQMVRDGVIAAGSRLPTERCLCEQTGLSRGTIKLAYSDLIRIGFARSIQGSGTYIVGTERKITELAAAEEIRIILEDLLQKDMSLSQIQTLFLSAFKKKSDELKQVKIAFIDCCTECLTMATQQLENVKNTDITQFLLDDVLKQPLELFDSFDMVLTTERHFKEIAPIAGEKADLIERVSLSLNQETIIELAKIPKNKQVLLWAKTVTFMRIFEALLQDFSNIKNISRLHGNVYEPMLEHCAQSSDYLLLPACYEELNEPQVLSLAADFKRSGKKVILFQYNLDKGSMLNFNGSVDDIYKFKCASSPI